MGMGSGGARGSALAHRLAHLAHDLEEDGLTLRGRRRRTRASAQSSRKREIAGNDNGRVTLTWYAKTKEPSEEDDWRKEAPRGGAAWVTTWLGWLLSKAGNKGA